MQNANYRTRQCPVMKENNEDCYFAKMNSLNAWATINLCGGNFEDCKIYQKWSKSHGTNVTSIKNMEEASE
ncbi:MAG: hypothetical protein LWX52_11460 [Deltaproteobacteria bacterium]|nr:hypothetical protein [Deltaproteobacteria bacterium]